MKRPLTLLLAIPLLVAFIPAGLGSQSSPTIAPAATVTSKAGLVVSSSDEASDLGAAILSKGGNAVDAAVTTAFALAVTHPFAGNLGGGGFMVVQTATGQTAAFDYREKAPAKATPTMYLGPDGN